MLIMRLKCPVTKNQEFTSMSFNALWKSVQKCCMTRIITVGFDLVSPLSGMKTEFEGYKTE